MTIEPNAQVQGCQLGGDAALQAPQAAGARKVQTKDLLQVSVDRLDDLPPASMGTASGAATNPRIVLGGQDRCTVIRQPMRLPPSAEKPVVRHIGSRAHRPNTVPKTHRSRRSDIRPSTATTRQLLRSDGRLVQVPGASTGKIRPASGPRCSPGPRRNPCRRLAGSPMSTACSHSTSRGHSRRVRWPPRGQRGDGAGREDGASGERARCRGLHTAPGKPSTLRPPWRPCR